MRGTLRKVVRLLKNLRYDASPEINLSSYSNPLQVVEFSTA